MNTSEGLLISGIEAKAMNDHREEMKIQMDQLFKEFFIESMDAIVFWDRNRNVIEANHAACRLFECSLDILKEHPLESFVYEKDERFHECTEALEENGAIRGELLFKMYNKQMKYLEFTSKLNVVDGFNMTVFRNVTERYQMEQELRESEQKFRKVFEGSLEGMILWDREQKIVDINPTGEKYFKRAKEEIIGKTLCNILIRSSLTKEEITEKLKHLHLEGQITDKISIETSTGKKLHFEYSTKNNIFSQMSLTTFRDITEKQEMEESLRKSDTLSVIGQLAAGIAHEIRNPMTALKGFIQLLEDSSEGENSLYFDVITTELNRIDTIINDFLILAKPQATKFLKSDITQIMTETVKLLSAQAVLYNIQFQLNFSEQIPTLICEPNQLKQVFINIIKNGIEVMQTGGYITISIDLTNDHWIHVAIKDEGYGIPEEKLKKLGEPFFTTKERGTGLGLMVSYRIVEDHGGRISVESEVGKGTTFHVLLPVNKEGG